MSRERIYERLPWLRATAPRSVKAPPSTGRARSRRVEWVHPARESTRPRWTSTSPAFAKLPRVGFRTDALPGILRLPDLGDISIDLAGVQPPTSPTVTIPCTTLLGGDTIYDRPRTFRADALSAYENVICDLMRRTLDVPLHPSNRSFANIRTIDWGYWDDYDRSVKLSPDYIKRNVVYLPGWIDEHRGVRIYTFWRDAPPGPIAVGTNGVPVMPVSMARTVQNTKLLLELVFRSAWFYDGLSITYPEHESRYIVDAGDAPITVPAITAAMPGYPVRMLRTAFTTVGPTGFEPTGVRWGIELRKPTFVDAAGNPATFSWAGEPPSNTQIWWQTNEQRDGQWATGSERWAMASGLAENRVLLRATNIRNGSVVPYPWLAGPRTTPPALAKLFSSQGLSGGSSCSVTSFTTTTLRAAKSVGILLHEMSHLALKEAGVQNGHGTKCGGGTLGKDAGNGGPLPLVIDQDAPFDPSQPHYSVHWMAGQINALIRKPMFGLNYDDNRSRSYNRNLNNCLTCDNYFEGYTTGLPGIACDLLRAAGC